MAPPYCVAQVLEGAPSFARLLRKGWVLSLLSVIPNDVRDLSSNTNPSASLTSEAHS